MKLGGGLLLLAMAGASARPLVPTFSPLARAPLARACGGLVALPPLARARGARARARRGAASVSMGGLDWRYFAAGGLSAAWSHGYTTPIDVVKTVMQAEPKKYANATMYGAAAGIVRENGPGFLLQGLAPTVVGYGVEGALKFGVYELTKPLFAGATPSTFVDFLLASVLAGAVASVVLCPAEASRIRLVADPGYASGFVATLARIAGDDGAGALFGGLGAMLSKQVPYTMAKQVSLTSSPPRCAARARSSPARARGGGDAARPAAVGSVVPVVAAALASVFACFFSHPGDMVLTRCYQSKGLSTADAFRQIYDEHGLGGFLIGIKARFLHVGFIITMQLVVYDIVKRSLGLPATGH